MNKHAQNVKENEKESNQEGTVDEEGLFVVERIGITKMAISMA
jgi:hypothetical protein